MFHSLLAECRTHGHGTGQVCSVFLGLLTEAVDLYRGDFLAGFSLKDSVNFDDWQLAQTQSLSSDMDIALRRLILCREEKRDWEQAIGCAQRWLELDRMNETAHRHLMDLYARLGQRTAR